MKSTPNTPPATPPMPPNDPLEWWQVKREILAVIDLMQGVINETVTDERKAKRLCGIIDKGLRKLLPSRNRPLLAGDRVLGRKLTGKERDAINAARSRRGASVKDF